MASTGFKEQKVKLASDNRKRLDKIKIENRKKKRGLWEKIQGMSQTIQQKLNRDEVKAFKDDLTNKEYIKLFNAEIIRLSRIISAELKPVEQTEMQ